MNLLYVSPDWKQPLNPLFALLIIMLAASHEDEPNGERHDRPSPVTT